MSRRSSFIASSDITPKDVFLRRRAFLGGAFALAMTPSLAKKSYAASLTFSKSPFSTNEQPTPLKDIKTYNNFYEFGTDKADPSTYASALKTSPWSIKIDGLVTKPGDYALEDILKGITLEERIYRLRCVEGWSMVVPWIGFPLSILLSRVEPLGSAKYVSFETLVRPAEMRGQRGVFQPLKWPYLEGLRLDEALHPLTILSTGIYGDPLLPQNGAPIRLVVPWKYGFKSIKSIVRISLTENQPITSWNLQAPNEYGFYSNVNPDVDHPRWSQKTERRIGTGGLFTKRQPTLPFNGYADQVASLYAGMDLKKYY